MPTKDHLELFECLLDISAEVLRNVAELLLLKNNTIQFKKFLRDEKHFFYHQYETGILCCQCAKNGLKPTDTGKIETDIFNKVYGFNSKKSNNKHLVRKNGEITQKCMHGLYEKNVTLDELDLSALSYFLRIKSNLTRQETIAIQDIMKARKKIVHGSSSSSIEMDVINDMWTKVEKATMELSQPNRYKNMVKWNIKNLRARKHLEDIKDELKDTVKDQMTESFNGFKENLLGYIEKKAVVVKAPNSVEESKASGGDGQIKITTTIVDPSMSSGEQMEIIEKLPAELNVPIEGYEDVNIKIAGKKVNSIVLDLIVSSNIFSNTETLRCALLALVEEVLKKGNSDTDDHNTIDITVTNNSSLTIQENHVLEGLFTQQKSKIPSDVGSEDEIDTEETDYTGISDSLFTQQKSKNVGLKDQKATEETVSATKLVIDSKSEQKESILKLLLISIDVFTDILRHIVKESNVLKFSYEDMKIELPRYKHIFTIQQRVDLKKIKSSTDLDSLGFDLLFLLIKHTTTIKPRKEGRRLPAVPVYDIGNDIEHIREIRKKLFDASSVSIGKSEFEDYVSQCDGICYRIDRHYSHKTDFKNRVTECIKHSLDIEMEKKYESALNEIEYLKLNIQGSSAHLTGDDRLQDI